MGNCKYCGRDAGFIHYKHKECELRHQEGLTSHIFNSWFCYNAIANLKTD